MHKGHPNPYDEGHARGPRGRRAARCRSFAEAPRGAHGGPPFFGPMAFGGGPRGRGRKARRGDIRSAILRLLAEEQRNGYQIMQEVEERSGGLWRPSPGSVYPALQQLEDEGLVRSEEAEGRRAYALTDEGREYVESRQGDPSPWEQVRGGWGSDAHELVKLGREVGFAFAQLLHSGGPGQIAQAREVLTATRRDLYRILAEGEQSPEGAGGDAE
ncbi:MAG TPA: PadR family transcriptional regulator [Solirubrobacteraceae bacterium]|nr:PadR family transcriptional regulator [Solirubrobacteraceae bacterium]